MLIVVRRHDYDLISKLIIRMTTTLHDTFPAKLVSKIKEGFADLKQNQAELRRFIDKVSLVNRAIHLEDYGKKFKYVPDTV